jgi:DNA polymerase-1
MKYEIIGNHNTNPKIVILVPRLQVKEVEKHYYNPHLKQLNENIMIADLYLDNTKKKTPVCDIKEYLDDLLPNLEDAGITLLVVTQPEYFKVLTKKTKTDATIGDILNCEYYQGMSVTYCPNYSRVFYDPEKIKSKIKLSLDSVTKWSKNTYTVTGKNIIKFSEYPEDYDSIVSWLDKLLKMDCDLTCDIEAFDLKHTKAGLGTITFCWNKHEGIAFPIDSNRQPEPNKLSGYRHNEKLRIALKDFFIQFKNKMIYHNISFDVYVLIYQLFMDDILDQKGLLEGIDILLRNWDCTQLITYLATNSCAGNELGLKIQAQEFAGNYAQEDIHDITLISMDNLLEYNLIDGLSTWFVYEKNKPIMLKDNQDIPYQTLFKPAVLDVIQMQLTGMPINMDKVKALNKQLKQESNNNLNTMNNLYIIESFMDEMVEELLIKKNKKLKNKVFKKADMGSTKDTTIVFNPQSPKQLQRLLYDESFLGLPILDYTDTKQPATGAETLEKLTKHTKDPEILRFLDVLIEYKASAIILSTFLPAFLKADLAKDGWHYLFGNFRLGGTASGRLSSNNPNLQNIPSSGATKVKRRLAKMIKKCFEAPPGWVFVGLDFDSLEDKISAVTTKDPEKIKVYSDGYDGHCLRALAYFGEHMPDIKLLPKKSTAYKADVDNKTVYFFDDEKINYMGKHMSGKEFYNLIKTKENV